MSQDGLERLLESGAKGTGFNMKEILRLEHDDAKVKNTPEEGGLAFWLEGIGNQEGSLFLKLSKDFPYYFGDMVLFERDKNTIPLEDFIDKLKITFPNEHIEVSDMRDSFKNVYIRGNSFFFYITQTKKKTTYTISIFLKEIGELSEKINNFLSPHINASNSNSAEISYFFYDKGGVNKREITKDASSFAYISENLYPGLDVSLLVSEFLGSNENILILTGEAGVGKTTLVKYIIRGMIETGMEDVNIAYCKDENMVKDDKFWVQLSSEYSGFNMLILDDFDHGLAPRKETNEENSFVSKLLSFSDGIFDNDIKVIITTNREIDSIDSALVRPGRCFDILKLRPLSRSEAEGLWVNEMKLSKKEFNSRFPADISNIHQALLASEAKASQNNKNRAYLKEAGLSVRKDFENGYVKRRTGFKLD